MPNLLKRLERYYETPPSKRDPTTRLAYTLRLSPEMLVQLAEAANAEGRSLNAEIVQRLRKSLEGYRKL